MIPTGLGQIAAIMKSSGHNVTILDINATRISKTKVEEYIKIFDYNTHLYGISGLITTYKYQKWLMETIRKYSNKAIVCGGGCASTAEDLLWKAGASFVIEGEGENKLPDFVRTQKYNNIDDIPFPDWDSLEMETYLKNPIWGEEAKNSSGLHSDMKQERSMNVITSRGCPYSCNFCYDLFGKKYKQRSVSNVIAEIRELKRRYDVDFIGFLDDNMYVNSKWVLNFCEEMKKEKLYWGCHARVNEVNDKVLEASYEAGCRWIGYGIESGSQKILNNMNKKVKVKQAKKAIESTRKHNIYPNTTFIYGYPGEDAQTVAETIEFCTELALKPSFFYATPYPMSSLFKAFKTRILTDFKDFESYVEKLGDAKDYIVNLTDMSDKDFFKQRERLIGALN